MSEPNWWRMDEEVARKIMSRDGEAYGHIAAYREEIEKRAKTEAADGCVAAHGEGQESTIRDVNAGVIDDLIAPRLEQAKREGAKEALERVIKFLEPRSPDLLQRIRALAEPQEESKPEAKVLKLGHEYLGADPFGSITGPCVAWVKHGDIGCKRRCGRLVEEH